MLCSARGGLLRACIYLHSAAFLLLLLLLQTSCDGAIPAQTKTNRSKQGYVDVHIKIYPNFSTFQKHKKKAPHPPTYPPIHRKSLDLFLSTGRKKKKKEKRKSESEIYISLSDNSPRSHRLFLPCSSLDFDFELAARSSSSASSSSVSRTSTSTSS